MLSPRFGKVMMEQLRKSNSLPCTCNTTCPAHPPVVKTPATRLADLKGSESFKGDAYCISCKEKVEFEGVVKTSDSGRRMAMGFCPRCGTKVNRILGKAQ